MAQPPLTTELKRSERVVLRRMHVDDLEPFQAYRNDPDVARFQSWDAMSDEKARGFLNHVADVDPLFRAGEWAQIALSESIYGSLIGDMGLYLSDDQSEAEIGITLASEHQGKGLGTEAFRLAMDLMFDLPTVSKIICGADPRNAASLNMIRKLGFVWTHVEEQDEMFEMRRENFKTN